MVKRSAVIDEDHGYDQLMQKLEELEATPSNFYIGVFDSDLEQVIKAGVHEFGAPNANIPSRKWLSSFFDEHSEEIADIYQEAVTYWFEVGGAKRDVFQVFSEEVLVLLQGYLETNPLSPDLKPGTWKEKKTDTMMIETSQMVSAIAIRYHGSKDKTKGRSVLGKFRRLTKWFR